MLKNIPWPTGKTQTVHLSMKVARLITCHITMRIGKNGETNSRICCQRTSTCKHRRICEDWTSSNPPWKDINDHFFILICDCSGSGFLIRCLTNVIGTSAHATGYKTLKHILTWNTDINVWASPIVKKYIALAVQHLHDWKKAWWVLLTCGIQDPVTSLLNSFMKYCVLVLILWKEIQIAYELWDKI